MLQGKIKSEKAARTARGERESGQVKSEQRAEKSKENKQCLEAGSTEMEEQ